jgi:hypothetical protein
MSDRPRYFVLDANGEPRAVDEWTWMLGSHDRSCIVQQDYAEGTQGTVGVSTVFLGLDVTGTDPPVLWESFVVGTSLDGTIRRYTSRDAAVKGHADLLRDVQTRWARER